MNIQSFEKAMENTDTSSSDHEQKKEDLNIIHKVSKGTMVGFAGEILHLVLTFTSFGLIARYVSKKEFGYLSLALAIVNILAVLSCLGFDKSLPSFIANKLQTRKLSSIRGDLYSSFLLSMAGAMFFTIVIYLLADNMACFLHISEFSYSLRVFSLTIPSIVLSTMMVSYLQSFHNVWGKFYNGFLTPLFRVIFVAIIIVLQFSFSGILWAHVLSFSIVTLFLFFYTRNAIPQYFQRNPFLPVTNQLFTVTNQLFSYSVPLFIGNILAIILLWSDTLILGFFRSADEVGVYNAGVRLTRLLHLLYMSAGFIFLPIASQLYYQNKRENLTLLYSSITKWLIATTLPFFIIFLLAPNEGMKFLFGVKYGYDNNFVRILSLGFFSYVLVGMSEILLVAIGKHKIVMFCILITVICNVILNFILIPYYGKMGASIAFCISLFVDNTLSCYFVIRFAKIHPFTKDYLKFIVCSFAIIVSLLILSITNSIKLDTWVVIVIALFLVPSIFILTKSYSARDIALLRIFENKFTNKTVLSDKLLDKLSLKQNDY